MALQKMHVTYRKFYINEKTYLGPTYMLNKCIIGVPSLEHFYQCGNESVDGRHLLRINFDDTEIDQEAILEALAPYGCHAKTEASALQFAKDISGDATLTMVDGEIVWPEPEELV